jgi:hypothetical protein
VSRTLAIALWLALGLAGCLPAASVTAAPPYRQGLIDPEWDPLATSSAEPQPRPDRDRALLRCRRLNGRQLGATSDEAQRRLLLGCLGRQPGDVQASRERTPHPLDLALFDEARPSVEQSAGRLLAPVVGVSGDRVEFLYVRGTRARLGVLDLQRPDRRRGPRGELHNTWLRIIRPSDPKATRYLAGELLAGFAAP